MARIDAYLAFGGNCREARTFYKDCLGGELKFVTVAETPPAAQMPASAKDKIMHASLVAGPLELLASDMIGGSHVR